MKLFLSFALILAFTLTGCSSFSKSGRQQRAYEKYVRKSSATRAKQQSRFRSDKPRMPTQEMTPSEAVETTEAGPQAVPPEDSQ